MAMSGKGKGVGVAWLTSTASSGAAVKVGINVRLGAGVGLGEGVGLLVAWRVGGMAVAAAVGVAVGGLDPGRQLASNTAHARIAARRVVKLVDRLGVKLVARLGVKLVRMGWFVVDLLGLIHTEDLGWVGLRRHHLAISALAQHNDLCHDADGDLFRRFSLQFQTDWRTDAIDLLRRHTLGQQLGAGG